MSLNIDFRALFVIVIVISTLAACYQDMLSSRQQNDIKTLSTACNNFMISLYKNLSTNIDNIGNIVISPLSLHMTLSLLSNGAGDHTLNEIKSVLHHDDIISLNNGFNILALLLNIF
ncbi:serpin A3-7-like isoform X4 [Monomorium pharaonis]|uniref:serpin A3-7-like isoform X4 n=1 Tax=Monomorium pharaonis TaxID=307658 RepID=UPI00174653F2|nr:serpin A3-7-like isoform X4 [Monomorium pharaonis]